MRFSSSTFIEPDFTAKELLNTIKKLQNFLRSREEDLQDLTIK
jgi:hypothetical protein